MSFELCNASTSFQSYINSTFQNYLNHFCTVYIDDILIYNLNKREHVEHVLKILRRLKEKDLQLDINKCAFEVKEILYLELIINIHDVKMNFEKVQAIID
jgi:hypothetical protein